MCFSGKKLEPEKHSSGTAELAAGKIGGHFQTQRRVKFLQIQLCGKQRHDLDAENFGQKQQFAIRHPAKKNGPQGIERSLVAAPPSFIWLPRMLGAP